MDGDRPATFREALQPGYLSSVSHLSLSDFLSHYQGDWDLFTALMTYNPPVVLQALLSAEEPQDLVGKMLAGEALSPLMFEGFRPLGFHGSSFLVPCPVLWEPEAAPVVLDVLARTRKAAPAWRANVLRLAPLLHLWRTRPSREFLSGILGFVNLAERERAGEFLSRWLDYREDPEVGIHESLAWTSQYLLPVLSGSRVRAVLDKPGAHKQAAHNMQMFSWVTREPDVVMAALPFHTDSRLYKHVCAAVRHSTTYLELLKTGPRTPLHIPMITIRSS